MRQSVQSVYVAPFDLHLTLGQFAKLKREIERKNRVHSDTMTPVPEVAWPKGGTAKAVGVWRSRSFLAVVYADPCGYNRLSVNRTEIDNNGHWRDGISWDELMEIKRQIGFRDHWSVEVFPPDGEIVNVANIRHLFILSDQPPYGWHSDKRKADVA